MTFPFCVSANGIEMGALNPTCGNCGLAYVEGEIHFAFVQLELSSHCDNRISAHSNSESELQ